MEAPSSGIWKLELPVRKLPAQKLGESENFIFRLRRGTIRYVHAPE